MPKKRSELIFVAVFILLFTVIPPFVIDLYPFSTMPMYCDTPKALTVLTLNDPAGIPLDPTPFSVHSLYIANAHAKIGIRSQTTANAVSSDGGDIAPFERTRVTQNIKDSLSANYPELEYVTVTPTIAASDATGKTIQIIEQAPWRVCNPRFPHCEGEPQ